MSSSADPTSEPLIDGRHARRERGRRAVIDATIDLVFEGHAPPSAEQVAQRSDVSVASLFRYFDTLEDLRQHAVRHYFERFSQLFEVPDIGVGSLDRRVATFVTARVAQHEATSPMAQLMRYRAFEVAELDASLRRLRATQSDQIRLHFEHELGAMTPAAKDDTVASLATITSFESWDQFRHDHNRSPIQTRRAWTKAVTRILHPA